MGGLAAHAAGEGPGVSPRSRPSVAQVFNLRWADTGGVFRYDAEADQYTYNMSTKGLGAGSYQLRVTVDGWPGFEPTVVIGLR